MKSVSGEDIDRSIEIIRQRIDTLGVSEPEVSRLGSNEISVSLPDITNATAGDRHGRDDRAALLLRLGAQPDRPREGDRRPPRPAAAPRRAEEGESGMESRRAQYLQRLREPAADRLRRLPDRLRRRAARLQAAAGRKLLQLLDRQAALLPLRAQGPAQADRRPRRHQGRPLHQPDRPETAPQRDRRQGPGGDDRRLRAADRTIRADRQVGGARLVRAAGTARPSRAPTSPNRSRTTARATNRTSPSASPKRAGKPSRK